MELLMIQRLVQKYSAAVFSVLCLSFCLILSSPARSQGQMIMPEPPKQIELNADSVKRFVASLGEIKKWEKANSPTSKTTDEDADEEGGAEDSSVMALIQSAKNSPEVKAILKKHNFDDVEKWSQIAQSVMTAYEYADPEKGLGPDYEANLKKSIEQVKNDKEYSAEEKAEAIKGIESELQTVQKSKPLPGNIEIVKPYVTEIKKLVESE
jgi:flagellar hook-basal body complex protein FliE